MRIYTGGGDKGETSLLSGERVRKDHQRVAAYGDVDELTSVVGTIRAELPEDMRRYDLELRRIQGYLWEVGALLASTKADANLEKRVTSFGDEGIGFLERAIDRMNAQLPELNHFIFPGGHTCAAFAHVARAVCRRCERQVVRLVKAAEDNTDDHVPPGITIFLNRLSDYLFVLSRTINHCGGFSD